MEEKIKCLFEIKNNLLRPERTKTRLLLSGRSDSRRQVNEENRKSLYFPARQPSMAFFEWGAAGCLNETGLEVVIEVQLRAQQLT